MGKWFTKFFKDQGFSVIISNRTKRKTEVLQDELGVKVADNFIEAIKGVNWILLCVSFDSLDVVLKEIGPYVRSDQVVMDINSIKEIPVNLLHKYVKNGVKLGTHPVFGPGAKNLKGQNFVLTPTSKEDKVFAEEYKIWLEKRGAVVTILSPRNHDMLMSIVLGFPHFLGLVAGDTLVNLTGFVDAKNVGGASYKLLLTLIEAVSSEEPKFYSNLHVSLPEIEKVETLFLEKVEDWLKLVKDKNCQSFANKMEILKKKLEELDPEYEQAYKDMYRLIDDC